ncbi:hypothetical protein [Aquimarina latercula]|uniref:hypothetical protein n=1 Tax=Aquimarina latercula TaxID=987 RepID=UPI00040B81F7|nr:hypothetical protein [Aquimarina latercula]
MTDRIELDNEQNKFILAIIKSMQIEMDDFMWRVANEECYESQIYKWAIQLYEKGTSTDYAIRVIHKARRLVLITKTYHQNRYTTSLTLEKLFTTMNEHSNYNKLDSETKRIVQNKIMEMFNHNARIEAIEQVLEKINPNVSVNKQKNQVLFIKVTVNRIMNAIRKWNLTEYWQNRSNK